MTNISIIKINATIVDYNESYKTVKVKIGGYSENNTDKTEKYIRVKYKDIETIK